MVIGLCAVTVSQCFIVTAEKNPIGLFEPWFAPLLVFKVLIREPEVGISLAQPLLKESWAKMGPAHASALGGWLVVWLPIFGHRQLWLMHQVCNAMW